MTTIIKTQDDALRKQKLLDQKDMTVGVVATPPQGHSHA